MLLNPRLKDQRICKVVTSQTLDKKALIELEGEFIEVNKIMGFSFVNGEYALLKTFKGSEESLVVAMSRTEQLHYHDEIKAIKEKRRLADRRERLSTRIIPINADISDEHISEKIKFLFQPDLTSNQFNEALVEVFSVVAAQENESYDKLKEQLYEKADTAINRNIILNKSFREAHDFMTIMVSRIKTKADHLQFFRAVNFFLKRLNLRIKEGKTNAEKVSAIFEPIYESYVESFGSNFLDLWVNKINTDD
ncbi:MAG: hypothetical protein COA79_10170 [Planctomycetota bacterium]|nr:MAG: hypothetical protein COA79_10170 [Planctomycetota bacterium]